MKNKNQEIQHRTYIKPKTKRSGNLFKHTPKSTYNSTNQSLQ